jgi:hypothetical protein
MECKMPKDRACDPRIPGTLCMGYMSCRSSEGCVGQLNGAMCVYRADNSSLFDVCSCMPIYPAVELVDGVVSL